ncbi:MULTISPECIES: RIP metalloprotease RseP [unclassified Bartonella]|uniref:RIP metalloprotease RseP n=1 Tax=unclassified Bartonella TaxID=2645622 RepID=UPI0009991C5F|nr:MULTISPECIES: RIP metalloprotease RseP [unclassified Bartonella]AQX28130.1 site-2 protease, Metallo peptidase, MEROPS family M50B [Bartonella sp. JB15]AQX29401.1 site-2 protease, Metallo peptidase, MEROPS family M50B [Bartonella sp. JB63]
MEFLNHILNVSDLFLRGLSVFFTIIVIVFVHEMGHYLIGRWCGIQASVFSIGFGPNLLNYKDKRGTQWRLGLFLLGGYVKFVEDGDRIMPSSKPYLLVHGSFMGAHAWKRAMTVFAGPLFNGLFAIVVLTFFFFFHGRLVVEPVVGYLEKDSPAIQAGLIPGDRFVEMDGKRIESFGDLIAYVALHGGDPIEFKVERMGQILKVVITPTVIKRDDGFGNQIRSGMIGVRAPVKQDNPEHLDQAYKKHIHYNWLESIEESLKRTTWIITQIISFFSRLIGGQEDHCQLSGPSKTFKIAWKISEAGFTSMLYFTAFFSVCIGLINLFPIPPLDGGHLLFYIIEVIIGKPVPVKIQEIVFRTGFFIIILFMIFALFNDYFCWFSY